MGPRQHYEHHRNRKLKKNFRWTTAKHGSVLVPLFLPSQYRLHLQLHGNLGPKDSPVPVAIEFNGHQIAQRMLPYGWQQFSVYVPPEYVRRGTNVLTFYTPEVAPSRVPRLPAHPKGRPVGIGVMMMSVELLDGKR